MDQNENAVMEVSCEREKTTSTEGNKQCNTFSHSGETQISKGYFQDLGKTLSGVENSMGIAYVVGRSTTQMNDNHTSSISDNSNEYAKLLDNCITEADNSEDEDSGRKNTKNEERKASSKEEEAKLNFRKMSTRDKITVSLLAAAHFSHMVGLSLMAPFFQKEAQKKGISQTVTGLIFSCFELCVLLSSPIFGTYNISTLGATFMFRAGITVAGVSTILFGVLHYCAPTHFVVMCFITTIFEALGISAYAVASFAIASNKFPDNMATIFGLMETALSLGFLAGPLFGSFLYQFGGYGLLFYVLGGFMLSMGVVVFIFFPDQESAALGALFWLHLPQKEGDAPLCSATPRVTSDSIRVGHASEMESENSLTNDEIWDGNNCQPQKGVDLVARPRKRKLTEKLFTLKRLL